MGKVAIVEAEKNMKGIRTPKREDIMLGGMLHITFPETTEACQIIGQL